MAITYFGRRRPTSVAAVSKLLLVGLLIVAIISSSVALVWYSRINPTLGNHNVSTSKTSFAVTDTNNMSSLNQSLASIAFTHWTSIAQRNLTALMSQYSTEYEALWWYANGSAALESLNGKHDCNVPTGLDNCSGVVSSAWREFFNYTSSSMKFTVCGFNITIGEQGYIFAKATLWYFLANANQTIKAPSEIDFRSIGEQWQLQRDWFGFAGDPASVLPGFVTPYCVSTSTTNR